MKHFLLIIISIFITTSSFAQNNIISISHSSQLNEECSTMLIEYDRIVKNNYAIGLEVSFNNHNTIGVNLINEISVLSRDYFHILSAIETGIYSDNDSTYFNGNINVNFVYSPVESISLYIQPRLLYGGKIDTVFGMEYYIIVAEVATNFNYAEATIGICVPF